MTVELVLAMLGWSIVINFVIFFAWFLAFCAPNDWLYRMHGRWFTMSKETFHALHYGAMSFYKLTIIVFNLVPYLALRIAM